MENLLKPSIIEVSKPNYDATGGRSYDSGGTRRASMVAAGGAGAWAGARGAAAWASGCIFVVGVDPLLPGDVGLSQGAQLFGPGAPVGRAPPAAAAGGAPDAAAPDHLQPAAESHGRRIAAAHPGDGRRLPDRRDRGGARAAGRWQPAPRRRGGVAVGM